MSSANNESLHERRTEGSEEQAQQQRIITHMNKNHRDSLSLFLQVYCKVPYKQAQLAQMEEFGLSGMTLSTAFSPNNSKSRTTFFIPFDTPLNGYNEARHKVVEMHKACLHHLDLSDITIREYRAPRGFGAVVFTTCLLTFITFSRRAHFQPGSEFYARVFQYLPASFVTFCYTIQPLLISLMAAIHLAEAVHLAYYRLRRHNIRFGSGLWLAWFVNDFVEGVTTLRRFDALVAEKRANDTH